MPDIVLIGGMSPRMTEGVARRFPFHRIDSEDALDTLPEEIRHSASVVIASRKVHSATVQAPSPLSVVDVTTNDVGTLAPAKSTCWPTVMFEKVRLVVGNV